MYNKYKMFICNCHAEALLVDIWKEQENPQFNEVCFAMFRSYKDKTNLWERLKYAWWHLRTGKRHLDQISFDFKTAKELSDFIVKNIK